MASSRLRKKKETLLGEKCYYCLLLSPTFKRYLQNRKKTLQDKIYHLRYIAQDCRDWKSSDLDSIRRGMEISVLRYRLAKELIQEAREVLDDMLSDVYPYVTDPKGLEEKLWEVFEEEDCEDSDESERNEAVRKLRVAGFRLPHVTYPAEKGQAACLSPIEVDLDTVVLRETAVVNQETEKLLALLEEKKVQLENLRELDELANGSPTST